ncbi:MAG: AAA family ATPase, partial [Neisseriaceae bacterium]|nr:AAA family ATPase [Neisseriaceae bacterium]
MIYLVTGTPGTGKTAFVMDSVLKNRFGLFKDENGNFRPMFSVNLEVIDKSQLPISPVRPEDFIAAPLHENFEEGSIIIVDEASEIYPVRAAATKLPPHIEGLNTLRHHGLTLIIITQAPTMIDIFVRNLVGKHWHIDRKQLGSRFYEWNKCIVSPGKAYFQEAYSEAYKPNPKVFGLYQSATKHIKFKKSVSWHYKAIPFLIILIILSIYLGYKKMTGIAQSEDTKNHKTAVTQSSAKGEKQYFTDEKTAPKPQNLIGTKAEDYKPRFDDHEETAPIYDSVRKVVDFPQVQGCVLFERRKQEYSCTCYTQQGSVSPVSVKYCYA